MNKTKFNNLEMWIYGWSNLIEGIVIILTLGFCNPSLSLWAARKIAFKKGDIK